MLDIYDKKKPKKNVKKLIRVIIPVGTSTFERDSNTYSGIAYDIWKNIKNKLGTQYNFEETFSEITDFDDLTKSIHDGKWDLGVGTFAFEYNRAKLVDFSYPIILSKDSILYLPDRNYLQRLYALIKEIFLIPILIMICLGCILGTIIHFVEPKRWKKSNTLPQYALRRSILTTISAFFGEMGYLVENSTLSFTGIFIIILITIVAFFGVMLIQAITTTKVLEYKDQKNIETENLLHKTFLTPSGYSTTFKLLGAHMKEINEPDIEKFVKFYLKNYKDYDGIALSWSAARQIQEKYKKLKIADTNIGFQPTAFVCNKELKELLSKINIHIVKLHDELEIRKICKLYYNNSLDTNLCIL